MDSNPAARRTAQPLYLLPRRSRWSSASRSTTWFSSCSSTACAGSSSGSPATLVLGRVLPGAAVSILDRQPILRRAGAEAVARAPDAPMLRPALRDQHGRAHRESSSSCCRPKRSRPRPARPKPARVAWQAGLLAMPLVGHHRSRGAFVADRVRRVTPRAALLSTLAGIAISFIAIGFLFRSFAAAASRRA